MQPLEQGRRDSESGAKRQATETVTLRTRGKSRVLREASVLAALPFGTDSDKQGPGDNKRRIGIAAGVAKAADALSKGNDSGGLAVGAKHRPLNVGKKARAHGAREEARDKMEAGNHGGMSEGEEPEEHERAASASRKNFWAGAGLGPA